jgi:toxin YoeB
MNILTGNPGTGKACNLIKDIHRNGAITGIGKPEPLIGEGDKYSRRIDEKNRLVYKYGENRELYIISCKGHYDDK